MTTFVVVVVVFDTVSAKTGSAHVTIRKAVKITFVRLFILSF